MLGNNHVVIRPPQKYFLQRRPPALFVQLMRGPEEIKGSLSKMFDGVYTLEIADEDAWGLMQVLVWTKSRPVVRETIEVDFGPSWMRMSRWMKVVEDRRAGLQVLIEQARIEAVEIASELAGTATQQAAEFASELADMAGQVSSGISKLVSTAGRIASDRQKDAEVYVKKAQGRAKSIWEGRGSTGRRK